MTGELAQGGNLSFYLPVNETVKTPISYYVSALKKLLSKKLWVRSHFETGCRECKAIWSAISVRRRTRSLLSLNMSDLRIVVEIMTGHCNIRYLTSRWNNSVPDYCNNYYADVP